MRANFKKVAEWDELSADEKFNNLFYGTWFPQMDKNELWFHYTSVDALTSMLKPNSVELWATQCRFVNDKEEIKCGVKRLAGLFKEGVVQELIRRVFSLCNC